MKAIVFAAAALMSSWVAAVQPALAAPQAKVTPLTTQPLPEYPARKPR